MAIASVFIDVNAAKAINALKKINEGGKRLGRTFNVLEKRNNGLTTKFNNLGKIIAGVGLAEFGRRAISTAANFEKLEVRLKLLTEQNGTFKRSLDIVSEAQKTFGLSSTEALEGITNITARLAPLNVGVEDIKTTFFGFNTAAKLAGASTIEASNAFRQLAQALGSGRLQGDEFRSIAEQVPTLLAPIAAELNTNVGGLKQFAAEGKLTSEVVLRALAKIGEDGGAQLKKLLENDPTQVFKDFRNAVEDLEIAVGKAFLPTAKETVKILTLLVDAVAMIPEPIITFIGVTTTLVATLTIAIPIIKAFIGTIKTLIAVVKLGAAIMGGPFTLAIIALAAVTGISIHQVNKHKKAQKEFNDLLKTDSKETINAQIKLLEEKIKAEKESVSNALGLGVAEAANTQKYKDQITKLKERLKFLEMTRREQLKLQGFTDKDIDDILIDEANTKAFNNRPKPLDPRKFDPKAGENAANDIKQLKRRIELKTTEDETDQKILERKFQLTDELRKALNIENEQDRIQKIELLNKEFLIDKQDILNDKLKDSVTIAEDLGMTLEQGLVENIKGAILGTQTFGQAMNNVLNNLKNKLLDRALSGIFGGLGDAIFGDGKSKKGIFGNIFRAEGGPVKRGQSVIVGEKGPELFTPNSSGFVSPNSALGGNINIAVSVDASGSSVQGDNTQANELGTQIAVAVQSELIKQKRAGGLLA